MITIYQYQRHGYATRTDYIDHLAATYQLPSTTVWDFARLLGESEDFGRLPATLRGHVEKYG